MAMQRITRIAGYNNALRQTGVRATLTQPLFQCSRRRVSFQCWDAFGNLKDGTDLAKRGSTSWGFFYHKKFAYSFILFIHFAPAWFILWANGVFDYLVRRRNIRPLEPDFSAQYPYRPQDPNYENPLFEPARRYQAVIQKKKERRDRQWNAFLEIVDFADKHGVSAALSSGIRAD